MRAAPRPRLTLWIAIWLLAGGALPAAEATDTEITRAIEAELAARTALTAELVNVQTEDGVVSLTGVTDHLRGRRGAVEVARRTRGVRAVVDRIEVRVPDPPSDETLQQNVRAALREDPLIEGFEVTATAEDGTVRLTGRVQSWQEKQLAGRIAAAVAGVRDLRNEIRVERVADRPDGQIAEEVRRRLAIAAGVAAGRISVEVEDGVVALGGAVPSLSQKARAGRLAWVAGVRDVQSDDLSVAADGRTMRRGQMPPLADAAIREAVRDAFRYDPRLNTVYPEVTVEDGRVTLTGQVDNLAAKRAAERDALQTVGVTGVRNLMRVRPTRKIDLDLIRTRVIRALERDPSVERQDVEVWVRWNATVRLTGRVDSRDERQRAREAAEGVPGVVAVRDSLEVRAARRPRARPGEDQAIAEEVRRQIRLNPLLDDAEISVTVVNGVARLTGTVAAPRDVGRAVEEAYAGGAEDVVAGLQY